MSKGFKITLSIFLCVILLALGFGLGFVVNIVVKDNLKSETKPVFVDGEISIHFLELGSNKVGDSIFIQCGESDILIDAGSENESSATIIEYVDNYVTDNKLEYVIATHGHEDHISAFYDEEGREGIFSHYDVGTIIDFPLTNSKGGDRTVVGKYKNARDKEVEQGAKHFTALDCYNNKNGGQRKYEIADNVEIEILYNYYYEHSSSTENDYSVCIMINNGDSHYLFTGDLEEKGEKKLVEYYKDFGELPHCVLYKAGHHGSKTSSSLTLLNQITPDYICICTCAGTKQYTTTNENQFPCQITINNFAKFTDKVYVTTIVDDYESSTVKPLNGNIIFKETRGKIELTCTNLAQPIKIKDSEWFKQKRVCPAEWL